MFPGLQIVTSEPIVDRRSTFLGHAIRVTDEREVPLVIHEILSDRKVAKAAHPAIFAYRIAREVGGAAGKVIDTGERHTTSSSLGFTDALIPQTTTTTGRHRPVRD